MADVMLKNAAGESKTYEGIETVTLPTSDGGTATFSLGGSGNADWAQTDPTQSDYIKNKPFGDNADGTVTQLDNKYLAILNKETGSEVDILAEQELPFEEFNGIYMTPVGLLSITDGSEYLVVWDGTEYTCTAWSETTDFGEQINIGDETSTPFALSQSSDLCMIVVNDTSDTSASHTVRIYQLPKTYTLKDEYRPDVPHFNLIELGLGDPADNNNGTAYLSGLDNTEIMSALDKGLVRFTFITGGTTYTSTTTKIHLDDFDGYVCMCPLMSKSYQLMISSDSIIGQDYHELPKVTTADNGKVLTVSGGFWYAKEAPKSLPEVTADDEGKVLSVKDGVWTATEAPASEGGSASTETDIFPETTLDGFAPDSSSGAYTKIIDSPFELVIGETYVVVWDGTEYTCVGQDASASFSGAVGIGDLSQMGGTGNGETFVILYVSSYSMNSFSVTDGSTETSHTVRIYQKKVKTDTVGWNDLFEKTAAKETEILPETSVTFTGCSGQPSSVALFASGATVRVIWDGTEYVLAAKETMFDGIVVIAVGNDSIVGIGEDTGEPFWFCYAPSYNINSFIIASAEESTYTVQIFQTTPERYTLKTEHVGNVDYETNVINKPFGEVAEAGTVVTDYNATYDSTDFGFVLMDINTRVSYVNDKIVLEDSTYSVEISGVTYDGVGMSAEAIKQLIPSLDVEEFSGVGIAIYQDGNLWGALANYQNFLWFVDPIATDAYTNGESCQVKITVVEAIKKIDAKYLPDSAKLPTVSTSDNGKVLTVVDGSWSASTPATGGTEIPTYDLAALGLANVELGAEATYLMLDASEILASLASGSVRFIFNLSMGEAVIPFNKILNGLDVGEGVTCTSCDYVEGIDLLTTITIVQNAVVVQTIIRDDLVLAIVDSYMENALGGDY